MLIELLKNEQLLQDFFCKVCVENGVSMNIDETIGKNAILIIKVDDYYNDENVEKRDCSPDCLIIQACGENSFRIYIVELKNIASPHSFEVKKVKEKFITCLQDFMSERFGHIFHVENINFASIKLFFVADPYGFKKEPDRQDRLFQPLKTDYLLAERIPKFFGKHLYIEPKIPNPMIKNCSNM